MSKPCKYEGKRTDARINVAFVLTFGACALACSFGEFLVFFILGCCVSQKCSQLIHIRFAPVFASGLEIRNHFQNRQEKNEFYFSLPPKFFLD
jgi:hypothetical protein